MLKFNEFTAIDHSLISALCERYHTYCRYEGIPGGYAPVVNQQRTSYRDLRYKNAAFEVVTIICPSK